SGREEADIERRVRIVLCRTITPRAQGIAQVNRTRVQPLDHKISLVSDDPVCGMQESTAGRVHRAHRREGKVAPPALRLHSLRSPWQAYGRKTVGLVEVWLRSWQRMITEVMLAANDIRIDALDTHWHQRPWYQDAGTPDCTRSHTRLKSHVWCQRCVGLRAY